MDDGMAWYVKNVEVLMLNAKHNWINGTWWRCWPGFDSWRWDVFSALAFATLTKNVDIFLTLSFPMRLAKSTDSTLFLLSFFPSFLLSFFHSSLLLQIKCTKKTLVCICICISVYVLLWMDHDINGKSWLCNSTKIIFKKSCWVNVSISD